MGPDFDMVVSDITGAFPGHPGLKERLGFIYNRKVVSRTEVATDISHDRSKVLQMLYAHREDIEQAFATYDEDLDKHAVKLAELAAGTREKKPPRVRRGDGLDPGPRQSQ